MTITTTWVRDPSLGEDEVRNDWYAYINNGLYTQDQQEKLVRALLAEQQRELEDLLPDGFAWLPSTSEIIGPVDAELDLDAALEAARSGQRDDVIRDVLEVVFNKVAARFEEIEREVLG
ncbi:hypothetical protein GCM10012275_61630 [Longimycelium tulufanense]|uniref:Uncharacterized protein n=1 Tax=Longimycelium tulufanense TaxID=907463 RepID=A0A8J3FZQ4_9PSEU|nr:hypothetical protein [Longimycelium tulufanense]GGM82805.1 hypothetical protein GCM10012275_61630 [Longimycelium tulufanense]